MKELYSLEELVPIVSYLSRKYTHGESTSVTYEVANQLMESVMYCIEELSTEYDLVGSNKLSAREAYDLGYEKVLEKTAGAQAKYNDLMSFFEHYGNDNLRDTITKGIPGFFTYYDPRLNPTNTIITMDYPIYDMNVSLCGIDAIDSYIDAIIIEQSFLKIFPREFVTDKLYQYHNRYPKEFINIVSYILRTVLADMMIDKNLTQEATQEDYDCLWEKICDIKKNKVSESLETQLLFYLRQFTKQFFEDSQVIEEYLKSAVHDFAVMITSVSDKSNVKNVVVL